MEPPGTSRRGNLGGQVRTVPPFGAVLGRVALTAALLLATWLPACAGSDGSPATTQTSADGALAEAAGSLDATGAATEAWAEAGTAATTGDAPSDVPTADGAEAAADASPTSPPADATGADVEEPTDVAEVVEDAAPGDATEALPGDALTLAPDVSPDVPPAKDALTAPPDASGANLLLHVTTAIASTKGTLIVKVLSPEALAKGEYMDAADSAVLVQEPVGKLPKDYWLTAPDGDWALIAMVLPGGGQPGAGAIFCQGGKAGLLQIGITQPAVQEITLELQLFGGGTQDSFCNSPVKNASAVLSQEVAVVTPPTKDGGPHFMQGLVQGERLWIAGSQDGLVSFDFPAQAQEPPPALQNWKVHGGAMCNRVVRQGNLLFCTSRNGYVHVMSLTSQLAKSDLAKRWLSGQVVTEGMAIRQFVLFVAVHGKGLRALDVKAPWDELPVTSPAVLDDTWDVQPLGPDHLVIANGSNGLAFLYVGGASELKPTVVAQLPLPGRAAFLHVQGTTVVVGALGGGLHVVDATKPTQPKLMGSLGNLVGNVYGVTVVGDLVVAAAGHHLIAADLPLQATTGPLTVRGVLPSKHFALDVDPFTGGVLTAEFQSVRRVLIDPQIKTSGPVALLPTAVFAPVTSLGAKLKTLLPVTNVGSADLIVDKLVFHESAVAGSAAVTIAGPWTIAPGTTKQLPVVVDKTVKGQLKHQLAVVSNDPASPLYGLSFEETSWLQPGDALPKLPPYQDAGGKTVQVADYFQGKVGVLIVAAQSCPVAFMGLAAASVDLPPLLQGGKVAALAINPWDKPETVEATALKFPFPIVYSPLTSKDGHDWSDVLDVTLGQALLWGPPMPIVYVVGKDGKVQLAQWGWESQVIVQAVQKALADK